MKTSNMLSRYLYCHRSLLRTLVGTMTCFIFYSCEKDFDIDIKNNDTQLVVEGYINNEFSQYNYVVLSRSMDYYNPDFQSLAVTGANVTITEGTLGIDGAYQWDEATKLRLYEASLPQVPPNFREGVYFDPRLITDSTNALKGKIGKHYLLEIESEGKQYSAIASLLQPVAIDSLTCGYSFLDSDDDNKEKARITIHYQDPDTLGNSQLYYWRNRDNRENFGWGGMATGWRNYGVDDLTNGQYMKLTQNRSFEIGDTVNYFMSSVTREVYDFWESYREARNSDGPFATPVTLLNRIKGDNVTGCFSGMSISSKSVVVYK